MNATNKTRSTARKIINNVYATATGLKTGSKGKVLQPEIFFGRLSKSEARRVRKALHEAGLKAMAAARRASDDECRDVINQMHEGARITDSIC